MMWSRNHSPAPSAGPRKAAILLVEQCFDSLGMKKARNVRVGAQMSMP
jgi:hypothetical protein